MIRHAIASTLSVLIFAAGPVRGQDKPASKAEIEQMIRQYIMDHPEILIESVRQYQVKQQAEAQQKAKQAVAARAAELTNDPSSPSFGSKDADAVAVVQFFDYRCGYCKTSVPTVNKLMADNPKVRVVYKEFPILGPDSMVAARAALAAHKQGAEAYRKMHLALMGASGGFTPEAIEKLATGAGLDAARLKTDMAGPEIAAIIRKNHELAEALGVESTPTFIVGGELMPGARDLAAFQAAIAKARGEKPVAKP